MRLAGLPIVMSLALFAAPAFAQSSTTATAPNTSSNMHTASNSAREQGVTMDTQQKIRHSLEQNGFKNVQVIPQSYVIRAVAPDGSRLVMEVSPDQFEEVIAPPVRSGSNASPSRSNLQGSSTNGPSSNSLSTNSPGTSSPSGSSPSTSSSTGSSLDSNSSGTGSMSGTSPSTSSSSGNSLNDNSPSGNSSTSGSMSR